MSPSKVLGGRQGFFGILNAVWVGKVCVRAEGAKANEPFGIAYNLNLLL